MAVVNLLTVCPFYVDVGSGLDQLHRDTQPLQRKKEKLHKAGIKLRQNQLIQVQTHRISQALTVRFRANFSVMAKM